MKKKQKPSAIIIGIIITAFIIGSCVIYLKTHPGQEDIQMRSGQETFRPIPADMPLPRGIAEVSKEGMSPHSYIAASLKRVVDGDTITVSYKNESYYVRLLDMDAPESVKKGVPVQAYGKEASRFLKKLVSGKSAIRLVFQNSIYDRYGRLLAYVLLDDGRCVNAMLVRNGYARAEVLSPNMEFGSYFEGLQQQAITEKLGLWSMPPGSRPFVKDSSGLYIPRYWDEKEAS